MNDELLELLRADGLLTSATAKLTPLPGGVSSEIYLVEDGPQRFVVKRALAKLKVKEDWFADIRRNRAEHAYMEYVARFLPAAVPALRGGNPDRGYFAMEFLGAEFANWKQLLLQGCGELAQAVQAALLLGQIHRASAGDPDAARRFDTTANFYQLRIHPYLLTTGARHPELRPLFEAEAARLAATRECLVHGDFSPKNILVSGGRMVVLDCEVAWYGDPAFDVAFLLSHLFLKALHLAPRAAGMLPLVAGFWENYGNQGIEPRVSRLLLLLLLARVDGKSPVEYLLPPRQQFVRDFVRQQLLAGNFTLDGLRDLWFQHLAKL